MLHDWRRCSAARRGCSPARVGGLDLLVLDAPALYDRPGNPYLDAGGTRLADNWRRFAALARAGADIAGGVAAGLRSPTSCTRTTGRRDWRRPTCATPAIARPVGHDRPQPRLPGPVPGRRSSAGSTCRRRPSRSTGVEYYGGVGFLKAGLAVRRPRSPRSARPTPRRSARRPTAWGSTGCSRARADVLHGIVNGIDTDGLEPRDRPAPRRALLGAHAQGRAPRTARAVEARFGLDADAGAALRRGQPADLAEGHRPARRGAGDLVAAGGQLAVLGSGEAGARGRVPRRSPPSIRGRVGVRHRLRRGAGAPDAGRRRRHPDPVALRALRADPALRPALRLRAGGGAGRRARRHGDRRQRRGARTPASPPASSSRRSTRGGARRGDPPRRRALPRSRRTGRRCSARA